MIILIWKGAGILVAVIWFFSIFAGDWLASAVFGTRASGGLCNLAGEWLAAALTLGLALLLRKERKVELDPDSGQLVEVPADHSLFFIPVIAWPVIFFILGIVVYYKTPAPSPAIFEVTPSAVAKAKQAAKSLPRGWYVRLQAYWPKRGHSPQYSVEIVTDLNRARDYDFEASGIKIVVLKRQVEMLRGAQLDFGEKDRGEGFRVNNPNFEGERLKKWRRDLELERPSDSQ